MRGVAYFRRGDPPASQRHGRFIPYRYHPLDRKQLQQIQNNNPALIQLANCRRPI